MNDVTNPNFWGWTEPNYFNFILNITVKTLKNYVNLYYSYLLINRINTCNTLPIQSNRNIRQLVWFEYLWL